MCVPQRHFRHIVDNTSYTLHCYYDNKLFRKTFISSPNLSDYLRNQTFKVESREGEFLSLNKNLCWNCDSKKGVSSSRGSKYIVYADLGNFFDKPAKSRHTKHWNCQP